MDYNNFRRNRDEEERRNENFRRDRYDEDQWDESFRRDRNEENRFNELENMQFGPGPEKFPMPPEPPMQSTPPTRPVPPMQPTPPTRPTQPMQPTPPMRPTPPMQPTPPTRPTQPMQPTPPRRPTPPMQPTPPKRPVPPMQPEPQIPPRMEGPKMAPPNFTPEFQQEMMGRPMDIRRCLNRFVYIWLINGNSFWFFPIFVGRDQIIGFRWRRNGWMYDRINLRRIAGFRCF